jgi:hypothetical protein
MDFPGAPQGGIVFTGFPAAKVSYNGLFYNPAKVTPSSSGSFTARTTDTKGGFSASLTLAGIKRAFSGHLDPSGTFSGTIPKTSLQVQLQLDSANQQIRGTVSDGHWTAQLLADQAVFNKTANLSPWAGNYTLIIPGDAQDANCPAGAGFGTVNVGADGTVKLAATLADGTKVTQSSTLSKSGVWPLYITASTGRGEVISWIQFTNASSSDLNGQLVWVKPALTTSKYYPRGFTNSVVAVGSTYRTPTPGTRAISMSSGQLVLSGGNLQTALTNSLTLGLNNSATSSSGAKLTITPASGAIKGTVVNPQTGKTITFQGMVYKKANVGVGYFLGTDQSGEVFLSPAP